MVNTKKTTNKPKQSDYVLPLIMLIVFALTILGLFVLLIRSNFATVVPQTTGVNADILQITCPIGQCATNLQTGAKTCPLSNQTITIDPGQYVCNSPYVCDNSSTPYALQSDGSTNFNGVCEKGVQCPCLKFSQCPRYVLSAFTSANGNVYQSFQGQRLTFPQISSFVNAQGNSSSQPPLQYTDPSRTFCLVPTSWLPLATPGCNFIPFDQNNGMTLNDISICMGLSQGCNGVTASPCLNGTLAIVTDNSEKFAFNNKLSDVQKTANSSLMGCVAGTPCPCGQLTVFDTTLGQIVCQNIPLI